MPIVATWALPTTDDNETNLERHLDGVQQAAHDGAELIVFPETGLHGYHEVTGHTDQQQVIADVYEMAEPLNGPSVRAMTDCAQQSGVHVVFGINERTSVPGIVYNTAVLAGPAGVLGAYRKVHVGVTQKIVWTPGRDWPVFDTPLGRIGLLICYDQAWPESCRELTLRGADVLVMPTAWAFEPGTDASTSWELEQYRLYGRIRAMENCRWFISSNHTGPLGGFTFFGDSSIIDPSGNIVSGTTGSLHEAHLPVADIDIRKGIETRLIEGAQLWRDRRPETYTSLAAPASPDEIDTSIAAGQH